HQAFLRPHPRQSSLRTRYASYFASQTRILSRPTCSNRGHPQASEQARPHEQNQSTDLSSRMVLALHNMTRLGIDLQIEMFIVVGPEDHGIEHLVVGSRAVRDFAGGVGVVRVELRIVEMGDGFNRRPSR